MRWDAALYLLSLLLFLVLANLCSALVETRAACNRTTRNSVGWIQWTGRMGRCTFRIRTSPRDPQVIELKVKKLQVGFLKEARCEGAYVQFSDGTEGLENETGRYCGHVSGNTTRMFLRKGPNLTIIMDSDAKFATENPVIFSAQYSILPGQLAVERYRGFSPSSSTECPLECAERNDRKSCKLASPGYPGIYPRGIRCRIVLESSAGRFKIGGQLDDLFDLMNHTSQPSCQTENCEQHVEIVAEETKTRVARSNGLPEEKISAGGRQARSSDQDEEELEFIIGQTSSRKSRRGRNNRRRLKKARKEADGSKGRRKTEDADIRRNNARARETIEDSMANMFQGLRSGSRRFDGYHDRGIRPESIQKRLRHPQRVHKKSMDSSSISLKRNSDRDLDDISDARILTDGHEIAKKGLSQERITALQLPDYRHSKKVRIPEKLGSTSCVGDYLTLLEDVDGKILEISKFCGEGHVPRIFSRGKKIIVEFHAEQDGTVMHDGFQLSFQETDEPSNARRDQNCQFVYRSTERTRESIKSLQSWYPPNTLCSYKFVARSSERISVNMKIIRNEPEEYVPQKRNLSLGYCSGNEIAVYNGIEANNSVLMWSYCDVSHQDINNIQVPLVSTGNELLIQYYSAKGSYDGQEFTYTISYKFTKKSQNSTIRRQVQEDLKVISLRPVNFSALNLNESENCNCDFGDRIGSFKNWFMVLVVFGIVSFLGAILMIIALLAKCIKMRSMEKKLLQTPKL